VTPFELRRKASRNPTEWIGAEIFPVSTGTGKRRREFDPGVTIKFYIIYS
jgi:hypothetical protein